MKAAFDVSPLPSPAFEVTGFTVEVGGEPGDFVVSGLVTWDSGDLVVGCTEIRTSGDLVVATEVGALGCLLVVACANVGAPGVLLVGASDCLVVGWTDAGASGNLVVATKVGESGCLIVPC